MSSFAQKQPAFRDEEFKIVQFTDIHWDQKSSKCAKTVATTQSVLKTENPDVAMLTGDVVTTNPGSEGWKSVIGIFEEAKIPFMVMMGSHDAEIAPKDEIYTLLSQSPYFMGEKGPGDIHGAGNYMVPVYSSGGKKPATLLYCVDSNDYPTLKGYGTYDWIHFDQINRYRKQSMRYTKENGGKPLPALAFFRIPLLEYNEIAGAETTLGQKEEGIASPKINTSFFASLVEMKNAMATFAGHDHDNDYIGMSYNVGLAFGCVSRWDAYGDFERDGRIIELHEGKFEFDSWIRTSSGEEYTYYYPSGLTSKDKETMEFLPAKTVKPKKYGVAYAYYEGRFKHTDQIASGTKVKEGTMKNTPIQEAPAKDHSAYEFRTLINIPEKSVYRFYTYSDDGSKLFIDGKAIVDNDGSHNARIAKRKVALDASFHELRVLYFENYMGETLEVGVSCRKTKKAVLPKDWYYLLE